MEAFEVWRDIARYGKSVHLRLWFYITLVMLVIFWSLGIFFIIATEPSSTKDEPINLGLRIFVALLLFAVVTAMTIAMPQIRGNKEQFYDLYIFLVNTFIRLPYYGAFLLADSMLWLWSRMIIIRPSRFPEKPCVSGCQRRLGNLCLACEEVVSSSVLLVGSSWALAVPNETHKFLTLEELEKSALSCDLCSVLRGSATLGPRTRRSRTGWSNLSEGLELKIRERRALGGSRVLVIQICGEGVASSMALAVTEENFGHECDMELKTGSPGSLKVAKRWIKECQDHAICGAGHPRVRSDFVPTRVLAIGEEPSATVQLVETKYMRNKSIEYAALSHCWGDGVNIRLTSQNIDELKRSLRIDGLPENFKHAIKVARGLGVPYLWIDSLCVVQGSHEDWVIESATMGMLYANAICTLSATASADAAGGFFYDKKSPVTAPVCVLRRQGEKFLVVRRTPQEEQSSLENLFDEFVERAPLTTRGWTFQERVLAQRVLHFCNGFVLFECNTMRASEYYTSGLPYPAKLDFQRDGTIRSAAEIARVGQVDEKYITRLEMSMGESHSASYEMHQPGMPVEVWTATTAPNPDYQSPEEKLASFFQMAALMGMRGELQALLNFKGKHYKEKIGFHLAWYDIVARYSVRQLTKEDDKLIALMGVAEIVQLSAQRTVVAGLWKEAILYDLLWSTSQPTTKRPSCVVPTWSWASVNTRVDSQLRRLFQNRTGVVQDSRNQAPALQNMSSEEWDIKHHWCDSARVETLSRNSACILHGELKLEGYLFNLADRDIIIQPDLSSDVTRMVGADVWFLPIFSFAKKNQETHMELHGIVLKHMGIAYERIGYFWSHNQALVAELRQSSRSLLKERISIR